AFEPDPLIFNFLKENISKNKIKNVTLNEKAVWISNDILNFASEGADGGNLEAGGNTKVEAVRLKDILHKHKEIDFLKMDIEGAETEVLIDCKDSLGNVKNVFIEYHSFIEKNQNVSDILEILNKSGFRYFVENAAPRMAPFINISKPGQSMDMQLNIFGYRTS
ncbi:MAG: FkbM family methyltransferase, partial [Bacteroidia bacterium]|nr:FkbM family methyltransferase [Bacteroidia bacterium]